MIQAGMLSGRPLAHMEWTGDERVAAYACWLAVRAGAPTAWTVSTSDLTRWLDRILDQLTGLREFVRAGIVTVRGR
jgi:hypothetical protein